MRLINFLVLFGLLALSQARPENGYSYNQPQQQQSTLQLSESQSSASIQQSNPQLTQVPQLLTLNEQSSSYQQAPLQQASYNLPTLPAPSASQVNPTFGVPLQQNLPQINFNQIQPQQQQLRIVQQLPQTVNLGQQSSSFLQQLPQPAQVPFNLGVKQSFPQPVQTQSQILSPSPSVSQVQTSFLSLQNQPQQQLLLPQQQLVRQSVDLPVQFQQQFFSQSSAQAQQQFLSQPAPGPIVTKHIYVHVAPDEPPQPPQFIPAPTPPPRKNYKIIFIKAPSQAANQRQVIHLPSAQQTVEEKTLVYVLVNKPQEPEIVVPTPAPAQPSKPEVYFIKYKANTGGLPGVAPTGPALVEDLKRNQESPISSGESSSSLFSGGLPGPKYGPPGYQKRST